MSDSGKLLGVNSFKAEGEALNFAVGVVEVKRFISQKGDRHSPVATGAKRREAPSNCEEKELYEGESDDGSAHITGIDLDCDGKAEAELRIPKDIKEPALLVVDKNKDDKPDIAIFDSSRRGNWEFSLQDVDFDGKWDLMCLHSDGDLKPYSCEPYKEKLAKR